MNGSMVTGVLGNVLVLSPLVIVAQGRLTHRLLVALTSDIVDSQMGFELYYAGLGKSRQHIEHGIIDTSTYMGGISPAGICLEGGLTPDPTPPLFSANSLILTTHHVRNDKAG
jgi:hypothetical protein